MYHILTLSCVKRGGLVGIVTFCFDFYTDFSADFPRTDAWRVIRSSFFLPKASDWRVVESLLESNAATPFAEVVSLIMNFFFLDVVKALCGTLPFVVFGFVDVTDFVSALLTLAPAASTCIVSGKLGIYTLLFWGAESHSFFIGEILLLGYANEDLFWWDIFFKNPFEFGTPLYVRVWFNPFFLKFFCCF